jgi:hypothetical protein
MSPTVPAEVSVSRRDAEDRQFSIEVAWCPACRAECTVEIVALAGDPAPVAICVDCGLGVETWWLPGLLTTTYEVEEAGHGVRAS